MGREGILILILCRPLCFILKNLYGLLFEAFKMITRVNQELCFVKHAAFLIQIKEQINEQDVTLIPTFSVSK